MRKNNNIFLIFLAFVFVIATSFLVCMQTEGFSQTRSCDRDYDNCLYVQDEKQCKCNKYLCELMDCKDACVDKECSDICEKTYHDLVIRDCV